MEEKFQDLSFLSLPEEREFEIRSGEKKKIKIYPLSVEDCFKFATLYFKFQDIMTKVEDLNNLDEVAKDFKDELLTLIAKSLRCDKKQLENANISFFPWICEQIMEVSRIDFFIKEVERLGKKLSQVLPSETSLGDLQEKKAGK